NTLVKTAGNKATPLVFLKRTRPPRNVLSPFSRPQGNKHTESLKMDAERFNSVLSIVCSAHKIVEMKDLQRLCLKVLTQSDYVCEHKSSASHRRTALQIYYWFCNVGSFF
ncbi:hypothetical protein P3395_26185, partial [Vibrio parahaemolyticus]|nr:hypothetical protein [Vibrio parahaemolyticus]